MKYDLGHGEIYGIVAGNVGLCECKLPEPTRALQKRVNEERQRKRNTRVCQVSTLSNKRKRGKPMGKNEQKEGRT